MGVVCGLILVRLVPAAFGVRGYPPDLVATFFRLSAEVANDRSNTPLLETIHPSEP